MSTPSALSAEITESTLPAQLEQAHELLDSAIRDKEPRDIARYSRQIRDIQRNLGHDISQENAMIQHEALDKLVDVMNENGRPRSGTLIIDKSGAFAEPWKARAIEISNELLDGGTNYGSLRIVTATRLVTEDPLFAEAVLEQAERDAEQALAPTTNQR